MSNETVTYSLEAVLTRIESFVATSRGDLIKAPRFLLKVQSKLKLLQRRLKHQVKGSNN